MRSLALAMAWLGLLLVGLGMSRRLVVCTQPCCAGHVKIVASCDASRAAAARRDGAASPRADCSCCGHDHDRDHGKPGDRPAASGAGCNGCVHIALGVDLGLPPADAPGFDAIVLPIGAVTMLPVWADAARLAVVHPPATGPPRCDRRTALLATTVLRL